MKIKTQGWYSVENCMRNPHKLYVFGDNVNQCGKAGQAIIRDCPNTFGIPTKIYPSMDKYSFFSDQIMEFICVKTQLEILKDIIDGRIPTDYEIVVFPKFGIGTGNAKLKETSPGIYQLIKEFFEKEFKIFTQK